ncbi:hypothetical protein BX283_0737 [Streptomyces sp. TLI_146]|nr:hypothetical protein BX283_0737 [Streptomyces sp. TLI_146]
MAFAFAGGLARGRIRDRPGSRVDPVAGAGRRYLVFLLCSQLRLPLRLGVFLHWAYEGGPLRVSGAAYQFRHRELQDWLADHPVAE